MLLPEQIREWCKAGMLSNVWIFIESVAETSSMDKIMQVTLQIEQLKILLFTMKL